MTSILFLYAGLIYYAGWRVAGVFIIINEIWALISPKLLWRVRR